MNEISKTATFKELIAITLCKKNGLVIYIVICDVIQLLLVCKLEQNNYTVFHDITLQVDAVHVLCAFAGYPIIPDGFEYSPNTASQQS